MTTQFLMKNLRNAGGEPLKKETNGEYMKQEADTESTTTKAGFWFF